MNQVKIGRFIAERRKAVNLTQMQLAEKLNITDRAVSKWETGKTMPDSAIMLELCNILKIKVNELLSGEKIDMENYNKEIETKLLQLVKEKQEVDKRLLTLEVVIGILSTIILIVPTIVAAYLQIEEWKRILIAFSGFIPGIIGFLFAIKIEQVAGYYECQKCGHKYVPNYKDVTLAMHMGRTRYMKCPKCGEWSWQQITLTKDDN